MPRRRVVFSLLLFALTISAVAGCSKPKFYSYYPLDVSNQWTYAVTSYENINRDVEERVIKRVGDNYYFNNKEVLLRLPQGIVNKMGVTILRDPLELGEKWIESQMTLEITAVGKTVEVPAGTFTDTVEITWTTMYPGDVTIDPSVQPTLEPGDNPRVFIYATTYAKNVGKIKEEYWIIQPDGTKTREVLAELKSFNLR